MFAKSLGNIGQLETCAQQVRPRDVCSDILVAELEPHLSTEPFQLLQNRECVLLDSPTLHGITQTRERIHDRIEVGGDIKAMEHDIVGGVAHDGQLGGIDFVAKAFNQLSTARSAGENDEHEKNSYSDGESDRSIGGKPPRGPPPFTNPAASLSRST